MLAEQREAIHFDPETGVSLYLDSWLLQQLFANPSLINRRRYRETAARPAPDSDHLGRPGERAPGRTCRRFARSDR
jgi:hypothetical protein